MHASHGARVAVLGTGGTISSVGRHPLDLVRYPENNRMHQVDELLAAFPETATVADILPVRFRAIGSPRIGPADWLELVVTIHDLARREPDLAGLTITHGTASLEETAYFLNLTLKVH
jgi:L-asparaginase